MGRYREGIEKLKAAILETPGDADLALRRRVFDGDPVDEPPATYVEKIAHSAYKITDEEVAGLPFSEDAILELTLAAALRQCVTRFEKGMEVLA